MPIVNAFPSKSSGGIEVSAQDVGPIYVVNPFVVYGGNVGNAKNSVITFNVGAYSSGSLSSTHYAGGLCVWGISSSYVSAGSGNISFIPLVDGVHWGGPVSGNDSVISDGGMLAKNKRYIIKFYRDTRQNKWGYDLYDGDTDAWIASGVKHSSSRNLNGGTPLTGLFVPNNYDQL